MRKTRFTEHQIIAVIKSVEAGGISATQSFGRDLKKCLELKRVYLQGNRAIMSSPVSSP
ncbi:hypothetical protein ACRPH4_22535 (plasmid) [Pantoea allii]|uniref:hypothetical protein n=1 Tax=Pantoea allii TaxID=574096 RepID=UPI003D7BC881